MKRCERLVDKEKLGAEGVVGKVCEAEESGAWGCESETTTCLV